jgi:hypothetical protein
MEGFLGIYKYQNKPIFLHYIFVIIFLSFMLLSLSLPSHAAAPCGADISKKLDLQVTCQETGAQDRRYYVKIFNRGTSDISFQNLNLTMKVWVYEPELRCLTVCGQNGDVYNSSGAKIGTAVIQGNVYSNFVTQPLYIENSSHKSNQEGTYSFIYQSGQSTIPAGGWVQGFQIIFSSACGGLSEGNKINKFVYDGKFYYGVPVVSDAVHEVPPGSIIADDGMIAMGSGNWDNFNDDYSGLPLGQSSCGGNIAGPYYDDHHFAKYYLRL